MPSDIHSETWAWSRLIEGLRQAEGAARVIAHARGDTRFVRFASQLGAMVESSTRASSKRVSEALLIAGREYTQ